MMEPDFQALYDEFGRLDATRQSLLKRAASPEDLLEIPAFYDLYRRHLKQPEQRAGLLRLIFCLPFVKHHPGGKSLGEALAAKGPDGRSKISEKRVIQISRIEDKTQAMSQLRRLLKHAEPTLDWIKAAKNIWYWGKNSRRQLLEDYFLSQPTKTNAK
jgi:CRISPR system Cascade subunit CasB